MFAAVDAQYREDVGMVSCVVFREWEAAEPIAQFVSTVRGVEPYVPGEFWRRELPGILDVLRSLPEPPSAVVVDGYVWLDDQGRKGLGAHLFDALAHLPAVIGVAKHAFAGSTHAALVYRGMSQRPLYVTAAGIARDEAAARIRSMHGAHRIPTLLKRVDQLCRRPPASRAAGG